MNVTLKIPILSDEQLKHLQKARSELTKAGVTFDSGYDLIESIFDWELDWSLEGAELLEDKTLQFNVYTIKKVKHIMNAEDELKQAEVYFDSRLDNKDRIIWELENLHGAELVIRKPRKEPTEGVKKVTPKLKPPFNIYRKTKHKKDSIVIRK
jgi:hypothetical protein